MTPGRWTSAAIVALVIAIVPGALQLIPPRTGIDRAAPATLSLGPADAGTTTSTAADVPIVPPTADLTGELAPALPAPVPFSAAGHGRPGEVVALVVGINDYPGSGSDLGAAVADADTVDAALAGFGVPLRNRVVLRDGQARRDELVGAIRALVATAGPGTTLVFAYAGHVRKLDADTEAIVAADGGLLPDAELASLLAPSAASTMWLLLATCYSGGFTEALGPGRILTAAADARSLAYESPSINGSYLVHHLVREGWLEGRSGPSVQEAFAYADARIIEQYPRRRPLQIDESGAPLLLGPGNPSSQPQEPAPASQPPPQQQPQQSPPPTSPPTTEPAEECTLLVLCHRT